MVNARPGARKSQVAIGLTTYLDISAPLYGAAVFDAYAAVSDRITPNRVNVWSQTYTVSTAAEFANRWLTLAPTVVQAHRGGPVIERYDARVGAEWRRTGALSGRGQVHFRPDNDPQQDDCLLIEHTFSSRVDWLDLFLRLIAILKPAHGMLHLFTDVERPQARTFGEVYFDGPIGGERSFTRVRGPMGDWSYPRQGDLVARRRYRYMTQLSWANYLGPQFDGAYDRDTLIARADTSRNIGDGLFFRLTPALADVERNYSAFDEARAAARAAFAPGTFRL